MPITNKMNLPEPIVQALMRETYDPGSGDFSCTELISPPKIATLKKRHKDKISEDASDLLYSLYGQAMHYILERAGVRAEGYRVENRHYAMFGRWKVSAQYDCLFVDGGVLSDYKFTTTYAFQKSTDGKMEMKKEWYAQLNIQAEILRRDGIADPKKLQIIGLLRDWQPSKAAQNPLYPQNQIVIMDIPLAPSANIERYVLDRCALHQAARDCQIDDQIPHCNSEERWEDPTEYAVMKQGGKRSVKNFDSKESAMAFISSQKDQALLFVEERPSFPRRCMGIGSKVYCPARNFCHHYKGMVSEFHEQQVTKDGN